MHEGASGGRHHPTEMLTPVEIVCSRIPCFFATSATYVLSASRSVVTICSSVNRLFFMTSISPFEAILSSSSGPRIVRKATPTVALFRSGSRPHPQK